MISEDARLVIGFARENPGEYDTSGLIKKLRLHYIENGRGDPGFASARASVQEAMGSEKIEARNKGAGLGLEMERCCPAGF